ncbi:MAG: hypothetical protein H7237_10415 [Alkalinema sp. FL-bin-369]|nr:hypothetical protein [Leptolyngbyaceae cyanobacterium LF-bin-369]
MMTQMPAEHYPEPFSSPVILQPQSLEGAEGANFCSTLASAIVARQTVIVDLLWITQLEHDRLAALANAFLTAQTQGHPLTFLSMDQGTRMAFDRVIQQIGQIDRTGSYGVFAPEFEDFLDRHHQAKSAAALP